MGRLRLAALIAVLVVAGCAPAAPPPRGEDSGRAPLPERGRTLVMAARAEMPSLQAKPIQGVGLTSGTATRLFNAGLSIPDDRGVARPYLAEALPQLNADTWRVFPDGRMETTYRLRAGLTWHDGTPLAADDFVFSWQVYSVSDLGHAASPPTSLMEEVLAPDARTLVIRWRRAYPDAGVLEGGGGGSTSPTFPALPRHLLQEPFRQANWESFATLPQWSTEFVGSGPYRLARWEAGSFLEGAAFDGHALGRPKIDRVRLLFIPDFNTTVANMLSGEAHITIDDSIRFQQGMVLKREWTPRNAGTVLVYPSLWRWTQVQQRPEFARPLALGDARVRKALAHSVDKQAMSEALFEGEGIMTETPVPPNADYFSEVDRASAKYPFDRRRSEQLMADAGWARGAGGFWTHPIHGRFETELAVLQSPQNENEAAIMAATWRQVGFDIREVVWPALAARDGQFRNAHPGLASTGGPAGEGTLAEHTFAEMPRPENRWSGMNRGAWVNPEFDRLSETFNATLDRTERVRLLVQMAKVFTQDAAVISLYFNPTVTAFAAGLTGPQPVVPTSEVAWNVQEWEFR